MSQRQELEPYVYGVGGHRFTQDSPVMPKVLFAFGENPSEPLDLLLTPHERSSAAELVAALRDALEEQGLGEREPGEFGIAYSDGYVSAYLDLPRLVRCVAPLSAWWLRLWPPKGERPRQPGPWAVAHAGEDGDERQARKLPGFRPDWLLWYLTLLGRLTMDEAIAAGERPDRRQLIEVGAEQIAGLKPPTEGSPTPLWAVNVNRTARTALSRSRLTVKADAAETVFSVDCSSLRWAIVDTGIDATHPAFQRRTRDGVPAGTGLAGSRVVATYDFTRLRPIVAGRDGGFPDADLKELKRRLRIGRAVDWDALEPLLRVEHDATYDVPTIDHGTHVAGIVGADWSSEESGMPALESLVGICPNIELYDLRVFDAAGAAEEFAITAALQFVRHLNAHSDQQVVHGVNLSISLDHDFANYAVGFSPACAECDRLMGSGVVVVVAAGNEGQATYVGTDGLARDGFRSVAITDPGNTEAVITVGSTHRQNPHAYGISYFSSRGMTGDGRCKPDLVAPGEKISSPTPGGEYDTKDGTSQATAHVSGVAAMLMARNPELMAQPGQVKEILCRTATDLGRERSFQGAGLIDALRALQAV